jgi:TetR/AcrR family transcriptional repressor of nem operon
MLNRLAFTPTQADAAMRLFWRHGYHGASLDQIAAVLGLTLEQVFAQVGGRSGLFLALLHHYRSALVTGDSNFLHAGDTLLSLERLFAGLAATQTKEDLPPAYLLLATAGEISTHDLVLNAAIQSYLDQIRDMLSDIVRGAARAQDLIADVDCEAAGDFLFGALLALRMMHRINAAPLVQRNFVSGVMHYIQRLKRATSLPFLEENTSPA